MNSAMMPADGVYRKTTITPKLAREIFEKCDVWKSYIGYPNTSRILSNVLGTEIPVSHEQTKLRDGDGVLVIKLKYRLQKPGEKKGSVHGNKIEDYEFSFITFEKKKECQSKEQKCQTS